MSTVFIETDTLYVLRFSGGELRKIQSGSKSACRVLIGMGNKQDSRTVELSIEDASALRDQLTLLLKDEKYPLTKYFNL